MKKKILAVLLALSMLLLLAVPSLAAGAETVTLVVNGPSSPPAVGQNFEVTVEVKNNPGFSKFQFTLGYDTEMVTCTKIVPGDLIKDSLNVSNPKSKTGASIAMATLDTIEGDGLMVTFQFNVVAEWTGTVLWAAKNDLGPQEGGLFDIQIEWTGVNGSETGPTPAEPTTPPTEPTVPPTEPTTPPEEPTTPPEQPTEPPAGGQETEQPEEPTVPTFSDVENHWGKEYIMAAAEQGLFKGYQDGTFRPNANVTRAQFVTVLYRMAGSPLPGANAPFTDLAGQPDEFVRAISWAYEKGYVNGKTADTFDPSGKLTRQEAMKILFFYAGGRSGTEVMFTGIYDDSFADSASIASWAKPAMYWGVYNKLISGTGEDRLSPQGNATRAQLAKILISYLDNINEKEETGA